MIAPMHATAVARYGVDGWRGVLLTGPSGAGKSDLALRLTARGWRLVADDYSCVWASAGAVWAAAPERIAGRIEVRGVGIVASAFRLLSRIDLVVACGQTTPERMPEADRVEIAGISLPRLAVDIRPASAPDVVIAALRQVCHGVGFAPSALSSI